VVGRALVPKLVESGGQVRVYVRREVPEYRALGVKVAIGDADHEGRLESALEQVHTLVHLVGGPLPGRGVTTRWLNLEATEVALRAAENAAVRRILFLSPLGADPASDHEYLVAKGKAEEAIRESKLEYAIFRCAPVLAPGSSFAMFLSGGVPADARSARANPIAAQDVASALVAADTRDAELHGTWELGGPEVMTFDQVARRAGLRPPGLRGRLARAPHALAALYGRDAIADPGAAVAQFDLALSPIAAA
jgi:NADH dehydrogenase